jgi:hypothetical protein
MDALTESCPTKKALLTAWHRAAEVYSKTVSELTHRIGVLSKAEYEEFKREAENARARSVEAQANLDLHIHEHGCVTPR